jgi:hypothetical protein
VVGWDVPTRKEVITVTYSKPEVAVLGEAARAIQFMGKGQVYLDGLETHDNAPAYDLDE